MPPKKTMKAMKATMAPKAMKTMMKAPRSISIKTMKAAITKGKSKKAKDKPLNANVLEPSCQYGFNAKNAKVTFYYGSKPCTMTPNELKMMAATLLGPLQVVASASNATQVTASHVKG